MQVFIHTLLLFICSIGFAHQPEEGKVVASLGPYLYKTDLDENYGANVNAKLLGGIALIAEGDVDSHGGLEIGLFYMQKEYFRKIQNQSISAKVQRMYITIGYRYWVASWLSAALAHYSAFAMGDPKILHSDFTPEDQYGTSASDPMEYGVDFSIQLEPWREKDVSLIVDFRYSKALSPRKGEESNHSALLLAYKKEVKY